jgi:hypothetical protein
MVFQLDFGNFRRRMDVANHFNMERSFSTTTSLIGGSSSTAVKDAKVTRQEVVIAPTSTGPKPLSLGPLDGFNLRLWYIETTHFFPERIDTDAIRVSLEGLLTKYPSFAGRARKDASKSNTIWNGYVIVSDSNGGVPLVELEMDGDATKAVNNPEYWHGRGLANVPALSQLSSTGELDAPLMTVVIAHFTGGGSALGVAVNHGLVDGKGNAELLKAWSFAHINGWDHPDVPVLQVERPACLLPAAEDDTSEPNDVVFDTRSVKGQLSFCKETEPSFWKTAGNPRARLFFSWADLSIMKASTPHNGKGRISSTEAVGARVWVAFMNLLRPACDSKGSERWIRPYMMTQMRSPRHHAIPPNFLGNCVEGLYSPLVHMNSGSDLTALATGFRAAGALFQDETSKHAVVDKLANKIVNVTKGIWGSSAAASTSDDGKNKAELCGINAIQSFRLFGLNFGAGSCIGHIPFNLGNSLLIEEANGGVHIFLQPPAWANIQTQDWVTQVESECFRSSVLAACPEAQ